MGASPCCPGSGGRLPLLVWPHHPPVPASLHQPPAPPHTQGPGRWSQEASSSHHVGVRNLPPPPFPGAGLCAGLSASLTGDWCLSSLQQLTSQNRTLGLGHTGDSQVRHTRTLGHWDTLGIARSDTLGHWDTVKTARSDTQGHWDTLGIAKSNTLGHWGTLGTARSDFGWRELGFQVTTENTTKYQANTNWQTVQY